MLFVAFAFSVGGIFALRQGTIVSVVMGLLAIILFGIVGIPVSFVALLSDRMILRLTPKGFAFGTLRKKYFYKWSDIAVFGVGYVAGKTAGFNFRPDYRGEQRIRAINQASIGFDRFLPDTYGKTPQELADLLEEWRRRYSQSDIKRGGVENN